MLYRKIVPDSYNLNRIYSWIRSLHLYFGLFISPFILIFSISVLVLNHGMFLNKMCPVTEINEIKTKLESIPYDSTDLETAKAILKKLEIRGEIDFISRKKQSISFPVKKPGSKTLIEVNTGTKQVSVRRQNEGTLRGLNYLHTMPGQHNVNIRGNSFFIKAWKKVTDGVVYIILFLSTSGIFLWIFIKHERKSGLYALIIGAIIFTGLLFLIFCKI